MKRTDMMPIEYPKGVSISDRRHCRKMIVEVKRCLCLDFHFIACSGGLDSTVLVHAAGQALRIGLPRNYSGVGDMVAAVYLNHHLRSEAELLKEVEHVKALSEACLMTPALIQSLQVKKGSALQMRARDARYKALLDMASEYCNNNPGFVRPTKVHIVTAHNSNDYAETKLYQFITGKEQNGIPRFRMMTDRVGLIRPLLGFTRKDIERYARCFQLTWCEDSSNETDQYTRNKIRHHLIPWIESNINPGFVKMLS